MYDSSKYEAAWQIFDDIIKRDDFTSETTISYIFEGKSLVGLQKYEEGKSILNEFLEKYPASKYADEAKLTLAKIFVEQKDFYRAFNELISLIESSESPFYLSYSKDKCGKNCT